LTSVDTSELTSSEELPVEPEMSDCPASARAAEAAADALDVALEIVDMNKLRTWRGPRDWCRV
jgi:hypothetical protein